jgi:hypothetical protein
MAELSLSNIINVSVSAQGAGAGEYNTSNLAIFTEEAFGAGFGSLGYKIYVDPTEVATDFGSDSQTYAMALKIFSQQPNILANGGYLVVIPYVYEQQVLTFNAAPASGSFKLTFDGGSTAVIPYNATSSSVQTLVRALPGLETVTVVGGIGASSSLTVTFAGYYGNAAALAVADNTLLTAGSSSVTVTVAQSVAGEVLSGAITRSAGLVQYFGLMGTRIFDAGDISAAAAVVQALNKVAFFVGNDQADIDTGGKIKALSDAGYYKSRGLYYGRTDAEALDFQSAYAGRALSVVFSGSNTVGTMHLKDLVGILADNTLTQTLLTLAQAAGADVYGSFQGVPKVFCSGENEFYDYVYALGWFVGGLEIAGFNFLAQASTKIPQTESGMDGLKGAYRKVCEQAVTNQWAAPGSWNSPSTFGNQQDFLDNITQRGYYIYSAPIALQSAADREDRKAPLVQIAVKLAGAIHSSSVLVYVNK